MSEMNYPQQTNGRLNALFLLAAILVFAPTWFWLGQAWLSDPYYSHGPLVLVAALYFAWMSGRTITPDALGPRNWGLILVVAALGTHLWATAWHAFYLSALMLPLALLGLIVVLFGWSIARRFLFPLAFLILMVPLPLAERFGPTLEGIAASSATSLAQWWGVAARNDGAQVFLPNSTFTVGTPCGGLRSVIAIITLVSLWAYITEGRGRARALIVAAAIPIALAANTLRITLLFAISSVWGAGAGLDYYHTWSSPALFLGAFAILLLLARLTGCSGVRWHVVLPVR